MNTLGFIMQQMMHPRIASGNPNLKEAARLFGGAASDWAEPAKALAMSDWLEEAGSPDIASVVRGIVNPGKQEFPYPYRPIGLLDEGVLGESWDDLRYTRVPDFVGGVGQNYNKSAYGDWVPFGSLGRAWWPGVAELVEGQPQTTYLGASTFWDNVAQGGGVNVPRAAALINPSNP